ncbi:MAG: HAD family hydrolase [Candidatus Bipolaricaulia bacterium]
MDCFITDVDNTIADTRNRLRRSLAEIKREEVFAETADRFGGFEDYLDGEEEEAFWNLFLSDKFLHMDEPAPGAAEFLRKLKSEGVSIVYLTGRHEGNGSSMKSGTETWLEEHGFPSPNHAKVSLFMKPLRKMDDKEFKLAKLQEEFSVKSESGEAIGVGDHPNDALVYSRVGVRPILLNWLGMFTNQELLNSASEVTVVEDWQELETKLYSF